MPNLSTEEILEKIVSQNENATFWDGFNEAIVGYGENSKNETIPLYDLEKVISILMTRDGMEYEDAQEYIDYNMTHEDMPIVSILRYLEY